jgi:preprotein translocase subunit SecY
MNWKVIFKSLKSKQMRNRLLTFLGILVVYRFLAHIPVPLTEPTKLKEIVESAINGTNFGGFINLLSGGALTSFTILLAGLSPYITASIITQLLSKVIPHMEELQKDGESGRRKINQMTRLLTVPFAILQSIAMVFILRQTVLASGTTILAEAGFGEYALAVLAMSAGSILLMWLGELVTEQGIGNGISTIILAGIVSQLPTTITTFVSGLTDTSGGSLSVFGWFTIPVNPLVLGIIVAGVILILGLLYILVKINEAQRIITINYAKRIHGNATYGGVRSILPIKMLTAGVIPIIFAMSFMSLPAFVGQLLQSSGKAPELASNLLTWFQAPTQGGFTGTTASSFIYPLIYFILVFAFTYFYTSIVFTPDEIAENLQKQGGFIEGVRPGKSTEKYLGKTMSRLTLFGSLTLGLMAILPFVVEFLLYTFTGLQNSQLSISGTGLLIVATVALENLRQINSRALMITYDEV